MKQFELIGKTLAEVEYINEYGEGINLIFTDGTCLTVFERMQAGAICAIYDGEELESDHEKERGL